MPPAQSRTMKQRRVSLPGTSVIHQSLDGGFGETMHSFAKGEDNAGTSSATGSPINGWGVAFRDDLGLMSNGSTSSSTVHQPFNASCDGGDSKSTAFQPSSSLTNAINVAAKGQPPPSSTSVTTRRRRATTVTAKSKTREFAVPADPIPTALEPPPVTRAMSAEGPPSTPTGLINDDDSSPGGPPPSKPRKPRKRWTMEETQALVDGCNKWGVGNWKAILNDAQFQFQGRSPVDLKDRFRTYFPDAYRTHYPNAKTHLSTRIRSFLPDGTPIFAKTRSKKRRPFSAEEDAALRRGYERYGTTWATIVKDPVFKGMERRSTDLRDRFRNAFPDLYKAAGYKPRPRAGTTSSATSATAADPPPPPPKTKETKRGRKPKTDLVLHTPTVSRSTSKSTSRVPSGRKKRSGGAATGERPIAPGEPTAADFYRPRTSQTTQDDDDDEDDGGDVRRLSDSEQGYSSEEEDYEEEEQSYPLSAVSTSTRQSSTTSGATSPTKSEHVLVLGWKRELSGTTMTDDGDEEEDMDVDGDVMLSHSPVEDDGGIDGTELSGHQDYVGSTSTSTRRTSTSEAGPSSAAAMSPTSASRSIQDLLNTATAAMMAAGNTGNTQSNTAEGPFSDGMVCHHGRQQAFMHHNTPSTASVNNSVTSDDWNSISSQGGGYAPHGGNGSGLANNNAGSSAPWMSNPTSPTPSDFYHHQQMPQTLGHHSGGGGGGGGSHFHGPSGSSNSRIGKSAWDPQDWLSNNPRLDHNLNILGGNGALTSWPTPASDPHAVLDRYDLYSAVEAAHEFASEAAYGGHHHNHASHTHAYPDDSIFREFTHHRYAGDLIPGSGVAVHPPNLSLQQNMGGQGPWSFGALGLGLAALNGLDNGSLHEDYASSVTSGSNVGLAGMRGALRDVDELSVVNYSSGSAAPSVVASPMKMPMNPPTIIMSGQQQLDNRSLDLDAMILVDSDEGTGPVSGLGLGLNQSGGGRGVTEQGAIPLTRESMSLHLGNPSPTAQGMEEAGAITPTSFPASLPCPPSPLRLDRPRLPIVDFSNYRRNYPSPARPHSRSVTHANLPPTFRPITPLGARDASRSFSQPPSEHRLALQRSLSYLDPITSSHAASAGLFGPFVDEDPLAYNEPLSISSLDLQYGMSAGPNIFTPLTMFTDPPTIAPARTINSGFSRPNLFTNRPTPTPPPPSNAMVEDALDISALIHTSPVPAARNHQRHQSQSVTSHGEVNVRDIQKTKRRSWDGFDVLPHSTVHDEAFFLDFGRHA